MTSTIRACAGPPAPGGRSRWCSCTPAGQIPGARRNRRRRPRGGRSRSSPGRNRRRTGGARPWRRCGSAHGGRCRGCRWPCRPPPRPHRRRRRPAARHHLAPGRPFASPAFQTLRLGGCGPHGNRRRHGQSHFACHRSLLMVPGDPATRLRVGPTVQRLPVMARTGAPARSTVEPTVSRRPEPTWDRCSP